MKYAVKVLMLTAAIVVSLPFLVVITETVGSVTEYVDYSVNAGECKDVKSIYFELSYSETDLKLDSAQWNPDIVESASLCRIIIDDDRGVVAFSDYTDISAEKPLVLLHFKKVSENQHPVVNVRVEFKNGTEAGPDDTLKAYDGVAYEGTASYIGGNLVVQEGATVAGSSVTVPISVYGGDSELLYSYSIVITIANGHVTLSGAAISDDVCLYIPDHIAVGSNSYVVDSIADNVFKDNSHLKGAFLNEGLKRIGQYSFSGSGLESITLPTTMQSIDRYAFSNCTGLVTVSTTRSEGILPSDYESLSIDGYAFMNCTELRQVSLSFHTLTAMDGNPFYQSEKLQSIESVNGNGTFRVADNQVYRDQTLVIATAVSDSYETEYGIGGIGARAFMACGSLRSVTIHNTSSMTISQDAFNGVGLTSVTIDGPIGSIQSKAFFGNNLESVTLNGVTEISNNAFGDNPNLSQVYLIDSTGTISQGAFSGSPVTRIECDGNSSVAISNKAFGTSNATALSIVGPFKLTGGSIGSLSNLRTVTLSGVISIDENAFVNSGNIESFECSGSDGYTSDSGAILKNGAVFIVPPKAKNVAFEQPVSGIYAGAFSNNKGIVQVTFGGGATFAEIPDHAFEGCASLVSISIPDSVQTIGKDAFSGCSNLSEVVFGDSSSVRVLGERAFYGTSLLSVELPATLESIGSECFGDCISLTVVGIKGDSLTAIGAKAFDNTGIRAIELPGSLQSIEATTFGSCPNLSVISFGDGSPFSFDGQAVYQSDKLIFVLSTVISYQVPATVTEIDGDAFASAKDLAEIVCDGNDRYSSYHGILLTKDQKTIVAVPEAISDVFVPSTITELDASAKFANVNHIGTFYWEGESISLAQFSRLNADRVVLVSSGDVVLGRFAIGTAREVVIVSGNAIELTSFSIQQKADTVCLSSKSIQLVSNSFRAASLCIQPVSGIEFADYHGNFNVVESRYDALFVPYEGLGIGDSKLGGMFEFDEASYTVSTPISYQGGVSIFVDNQTGAVLSDMVLASDTISFSVDGSVSAVGDLQVSVDGHSIDPADSGIYIYEVPAGTGAIHIEVGLLSSDVFHDIVFDLQGGDGVEGARVQHGGTLRALQLDSPLRSGYTFNGWYTDESLSQPFDVGARVTSDVLLYAGWTYNDGKYLVGVISHPRSVTMECGGEPLASGELVQGGSVVSISFASDTSWECIGWTVNGAPAGGIDLQLTLDRDYYIEPVLRYTSPSNVLVGVTEQRTPEYGEDIALQWSVQYDIDASMSVWSGFPSIPAIMDNAVYIRAGTTLYKYDADTGEVLATAESKMLVAYYLYLGVGGGMVYDYATHAVYDSDLVKRYDSPKEFSAVFYDSGYFYGICDGKVYKMNAADGTLATNGQWSSGVGCTWFGMYGTTSSPVFANGHMYFIEATANSDYRGLASVDLVTGAKTTLEITSQSGRLLDDGWLTYDVHDGRVILFMSAYSQGLFDSGVFRNATSTAVVTNADGTLGEQCTVVDVEYDSSAISALVIFNGRGYANGSSLFVIDMDKLEDAILACGPGLTSISSAAFEEEYLIYKDATVSTHGSIVVSTGYYDDTGKVYIYVLPYNPPNRLYIFEDQAGKTEGTGYFATSKTGSQYSSQAVRATLKGNLVWYLDSGTVYCYGTAAANPYTFQIITDDGTRTISGNGMTALDALHDAVTKVGIQNKISVSGYVIELDGKDGSWSIESYYDNKWNPVTSLSSKANDVHHTYRIVLQSSAPVKTEVPFVLDPESLNLNMSSDGNQGTVSVTGEIPEGVSFIWEASADDVVSIAASDDGRTATITALGEGVVSISVVISSDAYFGEAQMEVSVSYLTIELTDAFTYDGSTHFPASEGVRIVEGNNIQSGAGQYRTVLLPESGYVWPDSTSDSKTVEWSISKAVLTATYKSETVSAGTAPRLEVTVIGFVDNETASTAAGYVAPKVTATSTSAGSYSLTPSGGEADNYTFTYVSGTLTIVEQATPTVTINKRSVTIDINSDEALSATLSGISSSVTWSSSDDSVVTVSANGGLTPVSIGTATITANAGGYKDTCRVTVAYAPLTLSKTSLELETGSSGTITVTLPPGYASTDVVWTASGNISIQASGSEVTVTAGSKIGGSTVTVTVGQWYRTVCDVNVMPKAGTFTYTFFLQAPDNAQEADFGTSGYSISDLRKGITLTAVGTDAGSALESALNAEGIPCAFYSGGDLKYWVDHIFRMGDVHLENGDWQYWIQYHDGSYNDWTLGYYTEGGSFSLIYGITSDPSKTTPIDVPAAETGLVYNGKSQTGVPNGTGYTVAGGSATAPGAYTATITLSDGYTWRDGTSAQKTVSWSISKAVLTATYAGETVEYGTSPSLMVTVTGFVNGESASTAAGYVAPKVTAASTSTGTYKLTPGGGAADNYAFRYVSGTLTIENQVESSETTNPDGSHTETTTRTDENGTTVTETTTSADGNTTTVVETDPDGNKTTTKTEKQDDGSVKSTTTNPDGSTEATSTSAPTVTKTDDGKVTETSSSTVKSDAGGNVTGYVDSTVTVVERYDGSKEVSTTETVKDASGKETYSRTEEHASETIRVEQDAVITESSSKITERESGVTTVVSESVTATVSADGWAETETVKEQSVTGADGKTVSTKVVETVTLDADGDTVTSVATEAVSADGKKTSERTVAAESADGTVRTDAEVSGDSAEIITVVDAASAGGAFVLSKEQAEQAVSLQEKVSDAIADVQDQTKVIQVESAGSAGSLTVAQDVIGTVAESGSSLRMSSSAGSLTVPSEVLSNISQEDEVTISVTPARDQDMSGAQKDAVSDAVAVDVRIMSGDRSLGNQLDGTVTISVRYTPADGKVAVAYYIADDGTRERMGGAYDAEKGEVSFDTTHCSIYAIFDEDAEPAGEGGSDNTPLYIGAAIAAVVLIAVAAVLISRRSRTTFP